MDQSIYKRDNISLPKGITELKDISKIEFYSSDFNGFLQDFQKLGHLPKRTQEKFLMEDIISCLMGFNGKYIQSKEVDEANRRIFIIEPSMDPSFKGMIEKILPVLGHYSTIVRFVERRCQFKWGRVNQSLAHFLDSVIITDHMAFVASLEIKYKNSNARLVNLESNIVTRLSSIEFVANVINEIYKEEARGGRTISLLFEYKGNSVTEDKMDILNGMINAACRPYFQSLYKWIHTGYVHDPFNEFMIEDNENIENDPRFNKMEHSEHYWKNRYTIRKELVPNFLQECEEQILRAGKYINIIRQCKEIDVGMDDDSNERSLIFGDFNSQEYINVIEEAYKSASSRLLQMLFQDYDIINRIKSVKRYFMMEQADFVSRLLDLCNEELEKPVGQLVHTRIMSLVEVALRQCCAGKQDPYKDDIKMSFQSEDIFFDVNRLDCRIIEGNRDSIENESLVDDEIEITGYDALALNLHSTWPVSLILSHRVMDIYQMIFRLLLKCKHAVYSLSRVLKYDGESQSLEHKQLEKYRNELCNALRKKMLSSVRSLQYYIMADIIETQWLQLIDLIKNVADVDELMALHWKYLVECATDCMLTDPKCMAVIIRILKICLGFCHSVKAYNGNKKKDFDAFRKSIGKFDEDFTQNLVALMTLIRVNIVENRTARVNGLLKRLDGNRFYIKQYLYE